MFRVLNTLVGPDRIGEIGYDQLIANLFFAAGLRGH
jgi:hypothetical protein